MVLSRRMRWILSFTAVMLIAIVSGTQYLFSAYGPALADRLKLSSTQTNIIASAGNYGLFLSSPFNGYLADNYGPRRVCLAGSVLISISFLCLALTFNGVLPSSFLLCAIYLMLTGVASSAGFMSAFTTSAKNFPNLRGVGLSVPLACFALSASVFSLVNSIFFKDDTYGFLVCIAISTGLCQFIGAFLLDPISLESITDSNLHNETTQQPSNAFVEVENNGHGESRQLIQNEETPSLRRLSGGQSLEIDSDSQMEQNEETPLLKPIASEPNISGRQLLLNGDAQLLLLVIVFLGGAGLMYINNVGTIAKLLYGSSPRNSPNPSHELQHIQNLHVFLLSIFSCIGRLSTGISSDITKSMYNVHRLWFIICAGILLLLGQILAGFIVTRLKTLWIATICIGFGYGCVFGVAPPITSEWFGLKQFGFNWGIMACGFAIGSQVFGLLFGFIYDHMQGKCYHASCYSLSFCITAIGCVTSIFIASALLWRRSRRRLLQDGM